MIIVFKWRRKEVFDLLFYSCSSVTLSETSVVLCCSFLDDEEVDKTRTRMATWMPYTLDLPLTVSQMKAMVCYYAIVYYVRERDWLSAFVSWHPALSDTAFYCCYSYHDEIWYALLPLLLLFVFHSFQFFSLSVSCLTLSFQLRHHMLFAIFYCCFQSFTLDFSSFSSSGFSLLFLSVVFLCCFSLLSLFPRQTEKEVDLAFIRLLLWCILSSLSCLTVCLSFVCFTHLLMMMMMVKNMTSKMMLITLFPPSTCFLSWWREIVLVKSM